MKIVNPTVETWFQYNTLAHIARCARVCYASDKITDNEKMCLRLPNGNKRAISEKN